MNRSLLETLHRSLATQLNAMFVMVAIIFFGGVTIRQFMIAMLVGMLSGTYSSLFFAVPLLVVWEKGEIWGGSSAASAASAPQRKLCDLLSIVRGPASAAPFCLSNETRRHRSGPHALAASATKDPCARWRRPFAKRRARGRPAGSTSGDAAMGLILLRFGEVALKGRNRSALIRLLRHNLRACLRTMAWRARWSPSASASMCARNDGASTRAIEPGVVVVSLSPAVQAPHDMQAISAESACYRLRLPGVAGVSFRVRARRVDKAFPFTSLDINRIAGRCHRRGAPGAGRSLDEAAITIGVEVTVEGALVFGRVIPAPGCLPLGMEGRVVALISGGIDYRWPPG